MGPVTAQLLDELGYDPDDGVPQLTEVMGLSGSLTGGGGGGGAGGAGPAFHVPAGAIVRARDGARPVAVARLDSGRVVVVDDVCPHDGGRISDGFVDGERLVCARHGWELEVVGGRCSLARSASCGNSSNC
jgi:nitrite reductase/ring-hydroxylating ferredoxin subunit